VRAHSEHALLLGGLEAFIYLFIYLLSIYQKEGMHPQENFEKKSASRLNLEAILANNTDYSEEFDGHSYFDSLAQRASLIWLPPLEPPLQPPLKEPLVDVPSLTVGLSACPPPPETCVCHS